MSIDDSARLRRNLESFCLVWLYDNVSNDDEKIGMIQSKLREIITHVQLFDEKDDCITYIKSITTEKIILILSTIYVKEILARIHDWCQLLSIYILSDDKKNNNDIRELEENYKKVSGIFSNYIELLRQLNEDQICREKTIEQDAANFLFTFCNRSEQTSLLLNGSFLFFQLFLHLLLKLKPSENAKQELVDFCRQFYEGNSSVLNTLNKFEHDYTPDKAIYWYTTTTCFYRIINKAMRLHDVEILIIAGFFIIDLYEQLKEEQVKFLKTHNDSSILCVYRGQFLSNEELRRLQDHIGEFLSMNSFISTSTCEDVALLFTLRMTQCSSDIQPVFFQIKIDTQLETKPYSKISHLSQFRDEDEVLIMAGVIFKIDSLEFDNNKNMWIVHLSICNDNEHELNNLVIHYKKSSLLTDGCDLVLLANLLIDMDKFAKAELLFQKQLCIDPNETSAMTGLGNIALRRGHVDLAMDYYQRALMINLVQFPQNAKLADNYHRLGNCIREKGMYEAALQYYNKALEILMNLYGEEYLNISHIYGDIAFLYKFMDNFEQSHYYIRKSLTIQEKILPSNHPHLAPTYNAVGWMYDELGDFHTALEYFKKAYAINIKTLPPENIGITLILTNLGYISMKLEQDDEALSYLNSALNIQSISLLPTHTMCGHTCDLFDKIYDEKQDYERARALEYYAYIMKSHDCPKICNHVGEATDGIRRMRALLGHSKSS